MSRRLLAAAVTAAVASRLKELKAQSAAAAAAAEPHVWWSGGEHVSTRRTRARSKIPGAPRAQDATGCRRRGNPKPSAEGEEVEEAAGSGRVAGGERDLLLQPPPADHSQAPNSEKRFDSPISEESSNIVFM